MRSTEAVGRAVKVELLRRGMTHGAFAEAVGMTPSALSVRLNGRTPVDLNELDQWAAGLDMTPYQLIQLAKREAGTAPGSAA